MFLVIRKQITMLEEYSEQELMQAAELYPYTWVLQNNIKTSNGMPFEFTDHRFMIDVFNDMSPLQVGLKAPQVGWTETMIVKSFFLSHEKKKDIIYTLPTDTDIKEMAGGKVNRIVAQNPKLKKWVRDHDSVEQKGVGDNIIYYRGTWTQKAAMMVSSDCNIHDETDASNPAVITQYETRLAAKSDGMRWYFSHPSLSGHGVDVYWQQSDMKEWFITCSLCSHEQYLQWPNNIDIGRQVYICSKCKGILEDSDRRNGVWRKTSEGIFSGYHISQLMCPWISAKKIIEAFNDPLKNKQYFWNYVLGLPYVGGDDRIEPSTVLKNCVSEVNDQSSRIIIGVDTGLPIHFVCSNKDGVFYYDTCPDYVQLEKLLNRWPKAIIVSDQGGDLIGIRLLQQKYPGRVFLCYYRRDRKTQELITWGVSDKYGEVYVDRNNMLTLMVDQLRDTGRIRLNGSPEEWKEFAAHFGNMYREVIKVTEAQNKDDKTLYGTEYVWKRNGPDHFAHSLLYSLVGLSKYGESMASIVSKSVDKAPLAINTGTDKFNVILSTSQYE